MSGSPRETRDQYEPEPGTLGAVLYSQAGRATPAEREWVELLESISAGDQLALHALYERAHRVVFTLAMRITNSRQTAEELTVDVFHHVWRHAAKYEPSGGTVLGWILNQARWRAIDRLRFEGRQKRLDPHDQEFRQWTPPRDSHDAVALKQRTESLKRALGVLTADEREAIERAYFSGETYSEVAERLNQPLGTIKTRIRSGLAKLRVALASGAQP